MKDKTLIAGDVNELKCILAFEERGYYTSIPFSGSCRYDVVADINGKLIKVQCKSSHFYKGDETCIEFDATRSTTNTQKTTRYQYTKEEIDYFYTHFNGYDFLIPVEETSTAKILRLLPPKNNQIEQVNIASDYLLDNVLESIINETPIKRFIDNYIISEDLNTKEIKEWGFSELQKFYSDRQIRYIKEAINMGKTAYNKKWIRKEFPVL